jgi:hypothetical protein
MRRERLFVMPVIDMGVGSTRTYVRTRTRLRNPFQRHARRSRPVHGIAFSQNNSKFPRISRLKVKQTQVWYFPRRMCVLRN